MLSAPVVLAPLLLASAMLLWPRSAADRAIAAVARQRTPRAQDSPASSQAQQGGVLPWARRLLPRPLGALAREVGDEEVLALFDALSPALRAGLTPGEAMRAASPQGSGGTLSQALAPVTHAVAQGRPGGAAWERVAERTGHPDLASLARAWSVSERLGCPLSNAVEQTALSCRARTQARQRLASATAGTRATSTLLTLLPVGGVGVALMLGLDPMSLYGTPVALACLVVGVLLILVGRWIVRWMIGRVEAGAG